MWSILNFGRYKDKRSLPEVVLHDPDYFFWGSDTRAFHRRGFPEAGGVAKKARHIKISKPDGEGWGIRQTCPDFISHLMNRRLTNLISDDNQAGTVREAAAH